VEEVKIPRCLYALRMKCTVLEKLLENKDSGEERRELLEKWGTDEWVKLHCAMCVKSLYAKSRFKAVNRYSVVNTL